MEQLQARDYFEELDHPVAGTLRYPGAPISPHSPEPSWVYRRAPLLGEDNQAIIVDRLGCPQEEFNSMQSKGVV